MDIDGVVFDFRAEPNFPVGPVSGVVVVRTIKNGGVQPGPNYDGTWNSVEAAMLYEPVRASTRWEILKYLIELNTVWISGRELDEKFGTEALRRVRELRYNYGWPIEERAVSKGAWEYRMNYIVRRPKRRRYLPRRPWD